MSNKSRLEANNASLQTILGKVNALPDAGSGGGSGGASVETCTVEVTWPAIYNGVSLAVTTLNDNSEIEPHFIEHDTSGSVTISNVVCGSPITVIEHGAAWWTCMTDNIEHVASYHSDETTYLFNVTATDSQTASITFYQDTSSYD